MSGGTPSRPGRRLPAEVAVALVSAAVVLGVVEAALHAAEGLVHTSHVPRCDLLVVLGGGALERVVSGADLMSDGACDRLMLTGGGSLDLLASRAGPYDALPHRFIEAPAASHSTIEDAIITLQVARARRFESVLVLTSPYHTRRASWVFGTVFARTGIQVGVVASDNFYMDYRRWWATDDGRAAVATEYTRLWLLGLLSEAGMAFASTSLS